MSEPLENLLSSKEMAVITVDQSEIAYIAPVMPKLQRKIVLIDPSTRTLYHGYQERKLLEALGTAGAYYDADKYLYAARFPAQSFHEVKNVFVKLGFTFKEL